MAASRRVTKQDEVGRCEDDGHPHPPLPLHPLSSPLLLLLAPHRTLRSRLPRNTFSS